MEILATADQQNLHLSWSRKLWILWYLTLILLHISPLFSLLTARESVGTLKPPSGCEQNPIAKRLFWWILSSKWLLLNFLQYSDIFCSQKYSFLGQNRVEQKLAHSGAAVFA